VKDIDVGSEEFAQKAVLAIYAISVALIAWGSSMPPAANNPCDASGSATALAWLAGILALIGGVVAFFASFDSEMRAFFLLFCLVSPVLIFLAFKITVWPGANCHPFY
jgi:hypothetical protein